MFWIFSWRRTRRDSPSPSAVRATSSNFRIDLVRESYADVALKRFGTQQVSAIPFSVKPPDPISTPTPAMGAETREKLPDSGHQARR